MSYGLTMCEAQKSTISRPGKNDNIGGTFATKGDAFIRPCLSNKSTAGMSIQSAFFVGDKAVARGIQRQLLEASNRY